MISVPSCRRVLGRALWWRGVSVLLVLGLVVAGLPRWHLHTHFAAAHSHAHADELVQIDLFIEPGGDEFGTTVTHVHEIASPAAASSNIDSLRLSAALKGEWVVAFDSSQVAYAVGPPPYRPPIA